MSGNGSNDDPPPSVVDPSRYDPFNALRVQAQPEPPAPLQAPTAPPSPSSVPVTSDVEALWVQAVARLDDPDAQRAFIDACARTQQLPLAMRRYRGLSASDPRAQAPLERVTRIYTAMMMPPAPTLDEGMPRRLKFLIGAVLGGAALLALGAALLSG